MYLISTFVTVLSQYSFFLSFCLSFYLSVCLSFSLYPSFSMYIPSIYMTRHSQSSATLVSKYITCTCSIYCNVHVLNYTVCHCLVSILFLSFFLCFFLSFFLSLCLTFVLSLPLFSPVGSFYLYASSFSIKCNTCWQVCNMYL